MRKWIDRHVRSSAALLVVAGLLVSAGLIYGFKAFVNWADMGFDTTKVVRITDVARPTSGSWVYTLFHVEGDGATYRCNGRACLFLKEGSAARVTYYPTGNENEVHVIQYLG